MKNEVTGEYIELRKVEFLGHVYDTIEENRNGHVSRTELSLKLIDFSTYGTSEKAWVNAGRAHKRISYTLPFFIERGFMTEDTLGIAITPAGKTLYQQLYDPKL